MTPLLARAVVRGPMASPRCGECPFSKAGGAGHTIPGEGPTDPDFIVVGEGPGDTERRVRRPFVGASGNLLDKAFAALGVDRSRVWFTNAVLCTPQGASDADKSKAAECCKPRLEAELAMHPGKPVLALGATASKTLLGDKFSISELAGSLHEIGSRDADLARIDADLGAAQVALLAHVVGHNEKHALRYKDGRVAAKPMDAAHGRICFEKHEKLAGKVDALRTKRIAAEGRLDAPRAVIPTVHPAAILRGGAEGQAHSVDLLFWNLVYDAGKIHRLARGEIVRFSEDVETEGEDPARAEELVVGIVADARAGKLLAVDTETDSLRPLQAMLTAIGLATAERGISIAWACVTPRARRLIAAVLADTTIRKVMHNRMYDRPVLARHKMPVSVPCEDTLLLHHAAFPGLAHDLQRVATQFFAIAPWKAEFRSGERATDELLRYNALDTLVTARLYPVLRGCVEGSDSTPTYDADLAMAEVAERMHAAGVPVDLQVNADLAARFEAEIVRARADIEASAASEEIRERLLDRIAFELAKTYRGGTGDKSGRNATNRLPDPTDFVARHAIRLVELRAAPFEWKINSPAHIVGYLRARGVPLFKQTDKGKISTDKEVLDGLSYMKETRDLVEYREASKMLSTFVSKIARSTYADGRLHPRWNIHMITGRWSAEDPQAQNWPKGSSRKGRPNLRAQVVAPAGRIFVGFDMAQIEARIIALLSGDPTLCEIFSHPSAKWGPGDIHGRMTRIVWPDVDRLEAAQKDELRDFIKRTEFCAFYGGSVDTAYQNLLKDDPNVKKADVERVVYLLQSQLTGVIAWHNELLVAVQRPPHEIRSAISGRRRVFPLGNASPTDTRNFPVQSTAADIMALGLRACMPRLPRGALPILQIHDACVFECAEADAERVKAIVLESFTQEHTYRGTTVAFPAEAKVGRSWADL